ncbi:MAG: TolC family protein [Deltaproteobacteria bacterium]|nr:TolC family protein [Deltaproteobacteria bacterium]
MALSFLIAAMFGGERKVAAAEPGAPVDADAPSTPGTPKGMALSLDAALARAESASGLVRMARAERTAVAARDVGARLLLPSNPLVSVGVGPRREDSAGMRTEGVQYAIHAEQTLEIANQRGVRRAEVAKAVDVATWRETLARAETRARVRAVYIGAQLAAAQVRSARSREELVQKLVDGVRTRVETGAASNVDLQLARLERGRATRDRITAELAVGVALSDLRVLIALPPGTALELTSPLATPTTPLPLATLLSHAQERRAELRVIESSQGMLDAAVVRLRREAVPNPTLFLDLQRDLPGQIYVGAGIALPLPVWRRNQGELAMARAERGRLQEEGDVTTREIAAEVERAYRAALAHAQMAAVAQNEILPAAEAGVDLVTQGWRAGKFDLFRVIQASREASDARRGQLESLGAVWEATIAVDRATGTP